MFVEDGGGATVNWYVYDQYNALIFTRSILNDGFVAGNSVYTAGISPSGNYIIVIVIAAGNYNVLLYEGR